ncbi:MAG TPA: NUDIX domain-containing protein [Candidatus Deferrimicrobium sp.]|nr:NUDIX domain-containing protein [Candidatus Deferrimicrobium sp.]
MLKEHAAGGVVFRKTPVGIDLLMITDRFGKLTLPKGKLEPGEGSREAALREIQEETGINGTILKEILLVKYIYEAPQRGTIDKQVDYYLIQAVTEEITPQIEEISSAQWMPMDQAINECGYANNLEVLVKAVELLK